MHTNLSTAVFLLNPSCRAIMATYELDTAGKLAPRTMFKTFDTDIKLGDIVNVVSSTRHGFTVVRVVDVDVEPDFNSTEKVEWIVGKVNIAKHESLVAQELQFHIMIQSAEKRKKRDELRAALLADNEALQALPIAQVAQIGSAIKE